MIIRCCERALPQSSTAPRTWSWWRRPRREAPRSRSFVEHLPDVTLMDLRLPDMSGIDAMIAIRGIAPEARILMLTTFEGDVEIQRALQAGARGYLLKSMPPERAAGETIRRSTPARNAFRRELAAHARRAPGRRIADRARDRGPSEPSPPATATATSPTGSSSPRRRSRSTSSTSWRSSARSDRTQAVAIAVRRGIIQL